MTTQQPTQQPEAPESPLSDRVSKLEAIAEETRIRLAENHADHQTLRAEILALGDKVDRQGEAHRAEIDRQGEAHRAEIRALSDKIDRQGEALNAKIDKQGESLRAEMQRQTYRIIGAFITVWAATVGAAIALFLAM